MSSEQWTPEDWLLFRRFLVFLALFFLLGWLARYLFTGRLYCFLLDRGVVGPDNMFCAAFFDHFGTVLGFALALAVMPARKKPVPAIDEESGWSR